MVLNPNAKLLAVVGAFQIAVVVLPRPGFTRLVPTTIDCKYVANSVYCLLLLSIITGQFRSGNTTMHLLRLPLSPKWNGTHGEKAELPCL